MRRLLLIFAILAMIWMAVPMTFTSGTEMAGPVGGPDPNDYTSSREFGWPLPWLAWERDWNEAKGLDSSRIGQFNVNNLVIHLLIVGALFTGFSWARRLGEGSRNQLVGQANS